MAAVPSPGLLEIAMRSAEESGVKLEIMDGLTSWEAPWTIKHQKTIDLIRRSIPDRGYYHFSDIAIRFDNDSFKRPDIAIYCKMPEDVNEATTELPEAVIEVVSKGYEAKDLQFGLPFYLLHGIREVVIYNPATLVVIHASKAGTRHLVAPCDLTLECGCSCSIPL